MPHSFILKHLSKTTKSNVAWRLYIDTLLIMHYGPRSRNLKASNHLYTGLPTSAIRAVEQKNSTLPEPYNHVNKHFQALSNKLNDLSSSDKNVTLLFLHKTSKNWNYPKQQPTKLPTVVLSKVLFPMRNTTTFKTLSELRCCLG